MNKCICINPPNKFFEKGQTYYWSSGIDCRHVYIDCERKESLCIDELQWYWYFKPAN